MQQRLNTQWDELNGDKAHSGSTSAAQTVQDAAHAMLFHDLNRSSFTAAPSLQSLRGQMDSHRAGSAEKLLDVLAEVYPHMTVAEAKRLVAKL